jgi:predicted ABC-type ATPase
MSGEETAARITGIVGSAHPVIVILAGPNGAGKSTFFETFIRPLGLQFVNADVIARTMNPNSPEQVGYEAAAAAENVRQELLSRGESFCMETVFSDREGSKLNFLREAQSRGYSVFLMYIGLDGSDLAITRVSRRFQLGGHDVPDDKITERYPRSLQNLRAAMSFVDDALVFDNSSGEHPYRLVAEVSKGTVIHRGGYQPQWWRDLTS